MFFIFFSFLFVCLLCKHTLFKRAFAYFGCYYFSGLFFKESSERKKRGKFKNHKIAEREGFEPSVQFPVNTLSRRAP